MNFHANKFRAPKLKPSSFKPVPEVRAAPARVHHVVEERRRRIIMSARLVIRGGRRLLHHLLRHRTLQPARGRLVEQGGVDGGVCVLGFVLGGVVGVGCWVLGVGVGFWMGAWCQQVQFSERFNTYRSPPRRRWTRPAADTKCHGLRSLLPLRPRPRAEGKGRGRGAPPGASGLGAAAACRSVRILLLRLLLLVAGSVVALGRSDNARWRGAYQGAGVRSRARGSGRGRRPPEIIGGHGGSLKPPSSGPARRATRLRPAPISLMD